MSANVTKNYTITGLSTRGTVIIRTALGEHDTGETPSQWGCWGLSPKEAAILRKGLTRAGRDRKPREEGSK